MNPQSTSHEGQHWLLIRHVTLLIELPLRPKRRGPTSREQSLDELKRTSKIC